MDALLTVVVPVRDRPQALTSLLESLLGAVKVAENRHPALRVETIVADDRSASPPLLPPGLRAKVTSVSGMGPGAARNSGARAARSDWLIFTDSDCVVSEDWILRAQMCTESATTSVIQGDPTQYTRATALGRTEEALYRHMYSRYISHDRATTLMLDSRNLIVRRSELLRAGGFDESGDDAMAESRALAGRLRARNIEFCYAPQVVVYHEAPASIESEMRTKFRHGRGRSVIWEKAPPQIPDLLDRYFMMPVRNGIDAAYVVPVHLAFIAGYSFAALGSATSLPERIISQFPADTVYQAAVDRWAPLLEKLARDAI